MRNLAVPLLFQGLWCMIFCDIQDPITSEINSHTSDLPRRTRSPRSLPGFCPDEWRAFGDNCYKEFGLSQNDAKHWSAAAIHCQSIGASLTSVHSKEEQGFLNSFAFDKSSKMWIGLRFPPCGGYSCHYARFEWKDNSPTNYLNWRYPVSPYGESCACMAYYYDDYGKWEPVSCSKKFSYICKKRKDPTLTEPGKDPSVCAEPQGWQRVRNSCYEVFKGSENSSTWSEAESSCNSYASNLASVRNIDVTMHLRQKMEGFVQLFWTGVKSMENDEYTWLGREILFYTNWMSGQPTSVSDKENCVAIDNSGQWVVTDCNEKHPFICEVREGVPTIAPPNPNMTCPKFSSKWNDFGGKYCYIVETTQQFTQMEASTFCCREGGSLASIHSTEELDAILHYSGYHWELSIGLVKDQYGNFVWNDGSTVDFVNWDNGEPTYGSSEKCTIMHPSGKWIDGRCNVKYGYVCSTLKVPETKDPVKLDYVSQLSSGKIALIIIICLVLVAVVAGLGYYYFYLPERTKQSNEVLVWNMAQ